MNTITLHKLELVMPALSGVYCNHMVIYCYSYGMHDENCKMSTINNNKRYTTQAQ